MNCDSEETPILPGSWLGVFGGGQLGRMFTHAAQQMGYHVAILEQETNCPAAQAADRHFGARGGSGCAEEAVAEMAQLCDAVTLEFENIPAGLVSLAAKHTRTNPAVHFLEICQDRIKEKTALSEAGFPTTPFQAVSTEQDVYDAAETLGWPVVLKTARSGYDGKGQAIARSAEDVPSAWSSLGDTHAIAEKWIGFEAEVSMITARNARGEIESFPLFENDHDNHILDITRCPVSQALQGLESQADEICRGIADRFRVVGLFCTEFFVAKTGELMINEMAPRPHNSGHLTIEAFSCSQFEQQVRAICNLPLVRAALRRPAAMANLLGNVWRPGGPDWMAALRSPDVHLHLYGKAEPRPGRKMGHLTVLDESSAAAVASARKLRQAVSRTP